MAHEFIFSGEGTQPWGGALDSSKTAVLESHDRHSLLWNEKVCFYSCSLDYLTTVFIINIRELSFELLIFD